MICESTEFYTQSGLYVFFRCIFLFCYHKYMTYFVISNQWNNSVCEEGLARTRWSENTLEIPLSITSALTDFYQLTVWREIYLPGFTILSAIIVNMAERNFLIVSCRLKSYERFDQFKRRIGNIIIQNVFCVCLINVYS